MNQYVWRKSSRSSRVNCVEVALAQDCTAVRDSKAPEGGQLAVERVAWSSFLSYLKAGRFDNDLGLNE